MVEKLPIVYVRGFAGDTSGINKAVADPFYGFNEGSTHVRVGGDGEPIFYQFESPLLRLHLDEDYQILVQGGQLAYLDSHDKVPSDSIWIHRFYDVSATTWAERPQDYSLERAAEDLLALIEKLQTKTGAPRVNLVAHSMGGLICRCLIQKIIPDQRPGRTALDYVDKLFTYATPHGGIVFDVGFGLLERLRDATGFQGGDIFGPRRMYQYLTPAAQLDPDGPPEGWMAEEIPDGEGSFPKDRIFCLIGTNPENYEVAMGLSSATVGAKSDGLVQIEKAYVPGARRAFVHRSHSGPYGVVNSEEGYQNLRRFLFGDLQVQADLVGHRQPPDTARDDLVWQAEVRLSIRGVSIVMHEQTADHWCPIQLSIPRTDDTPDTPVPLVTTFLASGLRPTSDSPMRYALHLKILSLRERHGIFHFREHLERVADFDDILIVDIGHRDGALVAWAMWNSQIPGSIRDYQATGDPRRDEAPSLGPGSRSCIYRLLSSRSSGRTPGSSSLSHQGHSKAQHQDDRKHGPGDGPCTAGARCPDRPSSPSGRSSSPSPLSRVVACGTAILGRTIRPRRASRGVGESGPPCPIGGRRTVRSRTPIRAADAADTRTAIDTSPSTCAKHSLPKAVVPKAADGQSADGGLLGVRWARGQAGQPAW